MWLSKGWERILSGCFSFGEIQNLCPNYWSSTQPFDASAKHVSIYFLCACLLHNLQKKIFVFKLLNGNLVSWDKEGVLLV